MTDTNIQTAPVNSAGEKDPDSSSRPQRRRLFGQNSGWVLSLFLVGLGAKFQLILRYASPFPFWDQWPAEAIGTFIPWFHGKFTLASLFAAHNEHRIVFTRLCAIALLAANGQWDARLEMVFNAIVHSAGIAGIGWLFAKQIGRRAWPFLWCLLALLLVLPFAWENTLWGFQSQFYFLIILTVPAIWWLTTTMPYSMKWFLGVLASVALLFTMASGFLAVVAAGIIAVVEMARKPASARLYLPTLAVCGMVAIAGILLKPHIAEHDQFQAHSPGEFVIALGHNLAWPLVKVPWFALINLIPLAALAWFALRSRTSIDPLQKLILGLGLWAVLQGAASAFARGADGGMPAWRYMDLLCFLTLANALSIWLLLTRLRSQLAPQALWYVLFATWAAGCAGGLWFLTDRAVRNYIPDAALDQQHQLQTAREFLVTNDPRCFTNKPDSYLPVPNIAADIWLLRHPDVRRILPACARDSIPLAPASSTNTAFLLTRTSSETVWNSSPENSGRSKGAFESQSIARTALPYLEIPVTGQLGASGLGLRLVDLETGVNTLVVPERIPGDDWLSIQIRAPGHAFKLVAVDDSDAAWFGFQAPRLLGGLSYWSQRLLEAWPIFLAAGLLVLIASVIDLLSRQNEES